MNSEDCESEIICGGNPRPEDVPFMASTVWCVNEDILSLLEHRERQPERRRAKGIKLNARHPLRHCVNGILIIAGTGENS
jgi:hypothetical protein